MHITAVITCCTDLSVKSSLLFNLHIFLFLYHSEAVTGATMCQRAQGHLLWDCEEFSHAQTPPHGAGGGCAAAAWLQQGCVRWEHIWHSWCCWRHNGRWRLGEDWWKHFSSVWFVSGVYLLVPARGHVSQWRVSNTSTLFRSACSCHCQLP